MRMKMVLIILGCMLLHTPIASANVDLSTLIADMRPVLELATNELCKAATASSASLSTVYDPDEGLTIIATTYRGGYLRSDGAWRVFEKYLPFGLRDLPPNQTVRLIVVSYFAERDGYVQFILRTTQSNLMAYADRKIDRPTFLEGVTVISEGKRVPAQ